MCCNIYFPCLGFVWSQVPAFGVPPGQKAMATTVPKLSSGGAVKIRLTSIEVGTTKWKEGTFEILERDNKVNLCLRFSCGGACKTFQVWFKTVTPPL